MNNILNLIYKLSTILVSSKLVLIGLCLRINIQLFIIRDISWRLRCGLIVIIILVSLTTHILHNNSEANSLGLTDKGSIKGPKFDQSKRHYAAKKAKSTLLPITLKPADIPEGFDYKLAVTGVQGTRLTYQDIFKIIPIDKTIKRAKIFHNGLFATWDVERVADSKGVECPYMISWTVRKGSAYDRGVVYTLRKWHLEDNKVELIEQFLKGLLNRVKLVNGGPTKELFLYAHNSGLFDIHVILKSLITIYSKERKKEIPTIIADNQNDIYQLRIIVKDTQLIFRDSIKLFPISLKTVARNILGKDMRKFELNHDKTRELLNHSKYVQVFSRWNLLRSEIVNNRELMIAEYANPVEYLKAYCIQDSIIIIESLKKLSLELRALGFIISIKESITASSLGMKVWKAHFNSADNPVIQINMNTNIHMAMEKAYFGGRVEVFNSGMNMNPVYHFDVPGLYAGMMCKELPVGNPVYVSKFNSSREDFHKLLLGLKDAGLTGFFQCEAKSPENLNLPVLPVKWNGKLIFPLGSIVGTWALVELVEAINIGYVLQPIDGWVFKAGTPLKRYSEQMTILKDKAGAEGNKAARTLMKLLTNSLYGKLASKYFTRATVIINNDDFQTINEIYKLNAITKVDENHIILNYNVKPIINNITDKDLMKKAFLRANEAISNKDLNIAVAATVTAQGRVQLYKLMKEVVARNGVICYVDTDSVFCTLPEAPFNKPFGPYTWVGPAEEHTFNKALFIAPKMYYHEDLAGKATFKVKGVNTNKSEYTYEDLVYNFIKGASIKFIDQTQFRRTPKNSNIGIIITEGLTKRYTLATRSKRIWEITAKEAYTLPLNIVKENLMKANAISELPQTNLSLTVRTLQDIQHTRPIIPTTHTKVDATITQNITPGENAIVIGISIEELESNLINLWSHAISTTAYNCTDKEGNITNLKNIIYIQILITDRSKNVWKTIAYFKGSDWIGYTIADIKEILQTQIAVLDLHYNRAYTWSEVSIKINFESRPTIVRMNVDTIMVKSIQDIGQARKAFDETLETKKMIEQLESKAEAIRKMSESSKGIITILKTAQATTIDKFLKAVKTDIYHYSIIKTLREREARRLLARTTIPEKADLLDMRVIVSEALLKRLEITMTKDFKIRYHRWINKMEILLKIDLKDEKLIRLTHTLIFRVLDAIVEKEHLTLNRKAERYIDTRSKKFKTTPNTYVLRDKWNRVQSIIYQIGLLSAVRFSPKLLKYDQDSSDQVLKSRDKVKMINKLNSTKIFFRPTYLKWLEEVLFPIANEPEQLMKLINLSEPGELNAIIVEIRTTKLCIIYLKTWMEAIKQDFYYNTHFSDRRGRVYAELTNFRHIGSKWLRPLFCLEKSRIILRNSWKPWLKMMITPTDQVERLSIYWTKVDRELHIDRNNLNTPQEILEIMKGMATDTLNPNLKARTLEVEEILRKGILTITRPFQIDMKNNAIQHAATIVNNTESILATGVIPSEWETDDLYTKIAKRTLNKIARYKHLPEFKEIAEKLPWDRDFNKDLSVKTLRAISKKPTMVSIYSATKFTIIQYVYEVLEELNIDLSRTAKRTLAITIIEESLKASTKEIYLMETIKRIVSNNRNKISWKFGRLSDFQPSEVYNKVEQKDFKINLNNKQFHTTYNLLTNKVDTQSMKYATFVNIIHSLDALHLNLVINRLRDTNVLTIHDAILTSWSYNNIELLQQISEKFIMIHRNHNAFKTVFNRLAVRLGRDWTYEKLIKYLELIPPIINRTGRLAA